MGPDTTPYLYAVLPHPPGINRTYRSTRGGRWYKTDSAAIWQEQAALHLRLAGFKPQPAGTYYLSLSLVLVTCRLDLDAPLKLAIDAVSRALCVDDRWLGTLAAVKLPATGQDDQRLEVHCRIERVSDAVGFRARCQAELERETSMLVGGNL